MNTRKRTTNKPETYWEYAQRKIGNLNTLMTLVDVHHEAYHAEPDAVFVLDYLTDIRDKFIKILGHYISWSEFETYYNAVFSKVHEILKKQDRFKKATVAEKDVLIHLRLGDIFKVSPPDEYLAKVLKNARLADEQTKNVVEKETANTKKTFKKLSDEVEAYYKELEEAKSRVVNHNVGKPL